MINNGDGSQNFCQAGWTVTRQLLPDLQLGAEIYTTGADQQGGKASTGLGVGVVYDFNECFHLLASFGPGIQSPSETNRYTWYVALATTF